MKKQKVELKSMDFNYIKTPSYRTYYANGIFGGLTPRGELYLELFIERNVTPKVITQEINNTDGKLGKEVDREQLKGMVREIECGVLLNIDTAKSLVEWLKTHINNYETIIKSKEEGKK